MINALVVHIHGCDDLKKYISELEFQSYFSSEVVCQF